MKNDPTTQTKGNILSPSQTQQMLNITNALFNDLPNFSDEYKGKYPEETSHIQRLQFEELKQKSVRMEEKQGIIFDSQDELASRNLLKRWGAVSDELLSFLKNNPKPGDIFEYNPLPFGIVSGFKAGEKQKYENDIVKYQTIRNFVCSDIVYEFGKT